MYFDDLQRRLLAALKARLQTGELSERRLARLTGISQPHIHNVFKGARILSPELADQILRGLKISLLDLCPGQELRASLPCGCEAANGCARIPVLDGWLGPGLPMPRTASAVERYPFPGSYLSSIENPLLARLAPDPRMAGLLRENDLVLLDHSPRKRTDLKPDALYVVSRRGEGLIRYLRRAGSRLYLFADDPAEQPADGNVMSLAGLDLLDIVRAKVAWLGRRLEYD